MPFPSLAKIRLDACLNACLSVCLSVCLSALTTGCANTDTDSGAPAPNAAVATPAAPALALALPALPYQQAVRKAAQDVLSNARLAKDQKYSMIVDPLVDGNSGARTEATAAMEQSLLQLVRENYRQVEIQPFNSEAVSALPLLMVGTFTPINLEGKMDGVRDAYRICFALADLKTGKIISKGLARSLPGGVDATPLAFFRDMPVWSKDVAVDGYIKTCQGTKAGDPVNPAYIDAVLAAATINEAISAYQAKRYDDALALYQAALTNPAGNQVRTHAGIYLANQKLGRTQAALRAFGRMTEMGLASDRLAVQFNFKPGSTAFAQDRQPYALWLAEIARQALRQPGCTEVAGYTRRGISEQMDERLSLARAEFVRQKAAAANPGFARRSTARGYGSQRTIIGTGKNDASDALDQRIEFKKTAC